jgi:hypothetical protein
MIEAMLQVANSIYKYQKYIQMLESGERVSERVRESE